MFQSEGPQAAQHLVRGSGQDVALDGVAVGVAYAARLQDQVQDARLCAQQGHGAFREVRRAHRSDMDHVHPDLRGSVRCAGRGPDRSLTH
uniref:Uncharacterized protein n=1 Tax=Streptomyces avermitilis TaxID=33903 RepID=A0A499VNQ7_STRAX|nr:hypothetical protein SAVMC3_22950 [Streptomyces avermitilis]